MTLITEPTKQRIANLFYLSSKKSSKEKFNYDGQADVSPLGSRASLATEREARALEVLAVAGKKVTNLNPWF